LNTAIPSLPTSGGEKKIVPDFRGSLCFAGNESAFCQALDTAIGQWPGGPATFHYAEIGIGNGGTLRAVAAWLAQYPGLKPILHAVDLPRYAGDAFNPAVMGAALAVIRPALVGSREFFRTNHHQLDFVFIDACHGYACAQADFLAAEKHVRPGGVISFHDTDPQSQGQHPQPHCGTGIDVRRAVSDLGLLNNTRPGWKKIGETFGNKLRGGHGCLFVRRL